MNQLSNKMLNSQEVDVAIIIPAYNEEESISEQIINTKRVMYDTEWKYKIIVVDDGSTDRTAEKATGHAVELIKLPQNCGYGAALFSRLRYRHHTSFRAKELQLHW